VAAARKLVELARRAADGSNPEAALRAVTLLRGELDALEREHVTCWRVSGASWAQVADALCVTRQAAQKRHRGARPSASGTAPIQSVLVTATARLAVRLARHEAERMRSDVVGTEHLLLGILRSGENRAAEVLGELGLSLAAARTAAQPTLVDGRPPQPRGREGLSTYARSVLEQSLREAMARGEGFIGVEHLLLALLREDSGGAARTLTELGVSPAEVRERLTCRLPVGG
jgi:hypothetical protein